MEICAFHTAALAWVWEWSVLYVLVFSLWWGMLPGVLHVLGVFQGLVLLLGITILFARAYILPDGLHTQTPIVAKIRPEAVAVPDLQHRMMWVSSCVLFCSYPFYPHLMQRFFAAKGPRDLKLALSFLCIEPYVRLLGPISLGILAIARWPTLPEGTTSDQVLSLVLGDFMVHGSIFMQVSLPPSLPPSVCRSPFSSPSCHVSVSVCLSACLSVCLSVCVFLCLTPTAAHGRVTSPWSKGETRGQPVG